MFTRHTYSISLNAHIFAESYWTNAECPTEFGADRLSTGRFFIWHFYLAVTIIYWKVYTFAWLFSQEHNSCKKRSEWYRCRIFVWILWTKFFLIFAICGLSNHFRFHVLVIIFKTVSPRTKGNKTHINQIFFWILWTKRFVILYIFGLSNHFSFSFWGNIFKIVSPKTKSHKTLSNQNMFLKFLDRSFISLVSAWVNSWNTLGGSTGRRTGGMSSPHLMRMAKRLEIWINVIKQTPHVGVALSDETFFDRTRCVPDFGQKLVFGVMCCIYTSTIWHRSTAWANLGSLPALVISLICGFNCKNWI